MTELAPNLVTALSPDTPAGPKRITASRAYTLRGKKNLDWFFQNKRWVRTGKRISIESAFAVRPLPEGETSIQFLFLAAKRNYKRTHDRNKIKRWLREAMQQTESFAELEAQFRGRNEQLLVMLRISAPMEELDWNGILSGVGSVAAGIIQHFARRKP